MVGVDGFEPTIPLQRRFYRPLRHSSFAAHPYTNNLTD